MVFFIDSFLKSSSFLRKRSLAFGLLLLFFSPCMLFAEQNPAASIEQKREIWTTPMQLKPSENYWILIDGFWTNPSGLILVPKTQYLDLWSRLELTSNSLELELDNNSDLQLQLETVQSEQSSRRELCSFKVGCVCVGAGITLGIVVTSLIMLGGKRL